MSAPGPKAALTAAELDFRSAPINVHSQDPPACLKAANGLNRSRGRALQAAAQQTG
jgi:hypothetical protein